MKTEILSCLRCPICRRELEEKNGSLVCRGNEENSGKKHVHCFDLSSSGYCDLSYRSGGSGDPKSAVTDRTAFLERGYYAPLADELIRLTEKYVRPDGFVVDEGCGEGYYSEKIAESRPEGILFGADLSKFAADKASRRRRNSGRDNSFYAVASIFTLPLKDNCADGALCMFSPVAEEENLRVLRPGGYLIVGSAGSDHLFGLKKAVYDVPYLNDPRADLPVKMKLADATRIRYNITVDNNADILRLFGMTPYRFRTPAAAYERLKALDSVSTEIDVEFRVYQTPDK